MLKGSQRISQSQPPKEMHFLKQPFLDFASNLKYRKYRIRAVLAVPTVGNTYEELKFQKCF